MTETENRKNHEYSYNKYYTMPSREELHRGYSGWLNNADFIMSNPGSIPDPNKPKKVLTEEQKEKLIQNLQKYRESKKK